MSFDIFFFLFLYLILVGSFDSNEKKVSKIILLCLGPVLVQSLRSPTCGTDVWGNGYGYYQKFTLISEIPLNAIFTEKINSFEQGYVVFNKLISFISDNPQIFLAVTSLFIFSLIGYIYYRFSVNVYLSIIIFVCFGLYVFSFTGLRQTIAFSITLFSFKFIVERKIKYFLVSVFLAFSLHSSAIIYFFVWPLWNIRHTNKLTISLLGITLLLLPFYGAIFSFIVPLLFREKYLMYMNGGSAINLIILYLFIYLLPLFIKSNDFSVKNEVYKNNVELQIENFIRWMAYCSFLFQSLGLIGGDSITRIAFYFSVFLPLYIPIIFKRTKFKSLIYLCITISFIAFFYYDTSKEFYNVVPYMFFWELIYPK